MSAWGLDDFELADKNETLVTFEPQDSYYRLDRPGEANLWHVAIYVFPTRSVPPVRYERGQSIMHFMLSFPRIAGVPGTVVSGATRFLHGRGTQSLGGVCPVEIFAFHTIMYMLVTQVRAVRAVMD